MSWAWDAFQKARVSIVGAHLGLLRALDGKHAISIRYWLCLRRLMGRCFLVGDALERGSLPAQAGDDLAVPELRTLLQGNVLGIWSLDRHSISLLWRELLKDRPATVLEFGAGLSTLVLARYAAMEPGRRVVSVEQRIEIKQQIEARLASAGLAHAATILHAPVTAEGKYQLDDKALSESLARQRVNWVLIDGPNGPSGCRVWTLPAIVAYCAPGARWFLHDAFRDGELRALESWTRWPAVRVEGIYPCGKGIATGLIRKKADRLQHGGTEGTETHRGSSPIT
jgi:hypothetical protein